MITKNVALWLFTHHFLIRMKYRWLRLSCIVYVNYVAVHRHDALQTLASLGIGDNSTSVCPLVTLVVSPGSP